MKGHQISSMLMVAAQRNHGQFDMGGNPYIMRLLKVMEYTQSDYEEIKCIALGHDLIKDTFGTSKSEVFEGLRFLESLGFSLRIINGIDALTRRDGESYEKYKARVLRNPDAVLVKMVDLRHNIDTSRLKCVNQKDIERIDRYRSFYRELERRAEVTAYVNKLNRGFGGLHTEPTNLPEDK